MIMLLISIAFGTARAERSAPRLYVHGGVDAHLEDSIFDRSWNFGGEIEFPLSSEVSVASGLEYREFPTRNLDDPGLS